MKLAGYATPEGTRRYRDRLVAAGAAHERHFREGLGGLTLSTIGLGAYLGKHDGATDALYRAAGKQAVPADRKSTRLKSSHRYISYAVFCLKKKKTST